MVFASNRLPPMYGATGLDGERFVVFVDSIGRIYPLLARRDRGGGMALTGQFKVMGVASPGSGCSNTLSPVLIYGKFSQYW